MTRAAQNNPKYPVHGSVVDAMSVPSFIQLSNNLVGLSFDCMKAIPADFIIRRALQRGDLLKGGHIVETSSGTFARGLAWASRKYGVQCTIVTSSLMDNWLKASLKAFGANVEAVDDPGRGLRANQEARMNRLIEIRKAENSIYWTCQYDNPDNLTAYESLAENIHSSLGNVDYLVGAVGTGGSTGGTAEGLRKLKNDVKLVGVDLTGSVLFGQSVLNHPRLIGGMSSALMPPCIKHNLYDVVSWVPENVATYYLWELYQTHMLYHGASSGSVYAVAKWLSEIHPNKNVVAIFPDGGYRYHETFYNDDWIKKNNLFIPTVENDPIKVESPEEFPGKWVWIDWNRRTFKQVLGRDPNPQDFNYCFDLK